MSRTRAAGSAGSARLKAQAGAALQAAVGVVQRCTSWFERLFGEERDPFRRLVNEHRASEDRKAWQVVAGLTLSLFVVKTAILEGLPALALLSISHTVIAQGLVLLITHRPDLYKQYRELWVSLALSNLTWVTLQLGLYGGTVVVQHHTGSAARLLLLMILSSSALWLLIYSLSANLSVQRMQWLLPLLAVLPLLGNKRVCERQVKVPDVAEPLEQLFTKLGFIHVFSFPATHSLTACSAMSPVHQCVVVNAWLTMMLGVLLPLCLLWQYDRRLRRMHWARQRLQLERESWQAGHAEQLLVPWPAEDDSDSPFGGGLFDLYLASNVLWFIASSLAL